jgi:phosphoenolpyruvate carboxylase
VVATRPYIDPSNCIQIEMPNCLYALSDPHGSETEALREAVKLTVNGIAAGPKKYRAFFVR